MCKELITHLMGLLELLEESERDEIEIFLR